MHIYQDFGKHDYSVFFWKEITDLFTIFGFLNLSLRDATKKNEEGERLQPNFSKIEIKNQVFLSANQKHGVKCY
jgi:hypothetical protein